MPGQSHRLFINFIYACPNSCFFCVDFKGDTFYGFDLKRGKRPTQADILAALNQFENKRDIKEIYFCGIGEPLLVYDLVLEVAKRTREIFGNKVLLGINTSGTFFKANPEVGFCKYFDIVQVSLNAENELKYNEICRPKFKGAYKTVMHFLNALKKYIVENQIPVKVELSVVDTSNGTHLPKWASDNGDIPLPDFDKCKVIADGFGWDLKIKTLLEDSHL